MSDDSNQFYAFITWAWKHALRVIGRQCEEQEAKETLCISLKIEFVTLPY